MNDVAGRIASEPTPFLGSDGRAPQPGGAPDNRPILLAIAAAALFLLIATLESLLLRWLAPGMSVLSSGLVSGATLGTVAIFGVSHFRLWHELGFRRPERWRQVVLFAPFILVGLAPLAAGVKAVPGTLVAWGIAALLIAFYKMVLLAGLLVALKPRGRWKAASLAALIFALFEFGGVLTGGTLLTTSLLGVMYFFLSFAYGAAWLRTETIWPLVLVNALMTFSAAAGQRSVEASNLGTSVPGMLAGIVVAIMLAVYGGFLMRKPTRDRVGSLNRVES